jgi:hypothetical protein
VLINEQYINIEKAAIKSINSYLCNEDKINKDINEDKIEIIKYTKMNKKTIIKRFFSNREEYLKYLKYLSV